uniref:Uncharacterized protein n=1 Tax=Oryza punctata TaxID=4537 RepID=A0A0E0K8V2_ORYPU
MATSQILLARHVPCGKPRNKRIEDGEAQVCTATTVASYASTLPKDAYELDFIEPVVQPAHALQNPTLAEFNVRPLCNKKGNKRS